MRPRRVGVPLWLDHVSVAVPDFREAVDWFGTRLGLRVTPSAADPARHGRIFLDRGYLEVSAREPAARWSLPYFFLRFADPDGLRRHLVASGLSFRFGSYEGVDGRWDDVPVDAGPIPLPILVRRTEPPEVAADWPPALGAAHASGARTLAVVQLTVPELERAVEAYARLLGLDAARATGGGAPHAVFELEGGRIVLAGGSPHGISGIELGVPSLAAARSAVGGLCGTPVAWADAATTNGPRIGFVELSGPPWTHGQG